MKIFVGEFDEAAIRRKDDRAAVEKAMAKTGLKYTDTKIVGKGEKMRLKIWLIDRDSAMAQIEVA